MRAIFHSQDASIIAGHAKLVADNLANKTVEPIEINLGGGYPGRMTPYSGVFLLIPTTSIELGTGVITQDLRDL